MGVNVKVGNIFESNVQTLVNTVNCVGVMGKGIALDFKKRFPEMFKDYAEKCAKSEIKLGKPYLFKQDMHTWILNFPTKGDWRSVSNVFDIVNGLEHLLRNYKDWGITSLAVPPLGCGHGQLEWNIVGPILFRYLSKFDILVELYAPVGTPEEQLSEDFLKSGVSYEAKLNPTYLALVEIISRIENEKYHWPVGRTTFQKIAYFATEFGLPTNLHFGRGSFGPFSGELKKIESILLNNALIKIRPRGRMNLIEVGPTYKDAKKKYSDIINAWEEEINKIADLFLRMNTQDAEIAATVYYTARELSSNSKETPTETDVLIGVKKWKQKRRPPLNDGDIAKSIRNLNLLHWLNLKPSNELPLEDEF